jgi:hypothetical protein
MSNIQKVDITTLNKTTLIKFAKSNEDLIVMYSECETFEPLQEFIDIHFTYTQEQLELLKSQFVKSR